MKLFLPLSALAATASCAAIHAEDRALVDLPYYRADGAPGWHVEIGDDIALRLGHEILGDPVASAIYRYPAVNARHYDGVRRWRSGSRRWGILVEALPGPCLSPDGDSLPDRVRIVHFQGTWDGCGGPWNGDPQS